MLFKLISSAAFALVLASPALAADIEVTAPFARATAETAQAGAAFMTLKNDSASDDKLVAASSPVANRTELHTHMMEGDVMRMREISSIDVPAGGSVSLQPGGSHVMLMGLKQPLRQGEVFPLTLTFAKAGAITVEVPVKAVSAMPPPSGHAH